MKKINYFKINTVNIKGNNFVDDNIIHEKIKSNINENILSVDLRVMQNNINKNEYIYSSKIYTLLPSYLFIEINEIIPVGIYQKDNKSENNPIVAVFTKELFELCSI